MIFPFSSHSFPPRYFSAIVMMWMFCPGQQVKGVTQEPIVRGEKLFAR